MQSIILTGADRKAAYEWLALRDGETGPETEASFQNWLRQSPRNRKAYEEANRLWAMLRTPALNISAANDCRPETRVRAGPAFTPWAMAASFVFAIAVAVWMIDPAFVQNWRADMKTAYGETRSFSLPDGSSVILGPDAALVNNFAEGERRDVEILRGEAFFRVKHGLSTPFVVDAGKGRVTVTGTAFDVDRIGDHISVVVENGSVDVSGNAGQTRSLTPSEKVSLDDGRPGAVSTVDLGLELGWMTGQISFDRQPVDHVMATLERYLPVKIMMRGGIGDRLVSGSFPTDDPEEAMQAIAAAVDARVTHITPWIVIVF
ncbi:UNVERIFIED_ORG: FecR family protein [Martelella mediterranea]